MALPVIRQIGYMHSFSCGRYVPHLFVSQICSSFSLLVPDLSTSLALFVVCRALFAFTFHCSQSFLGIGIRAGTGGNLSVGVYHLHDGCFQEIRWAVLLAQLVLIPFTVCGITSARSFGPHMMEVFAGGKLTLLEAKLMSKVAGFTTLLPLLGTLYCLFDHETVAARLVPNS